MEINTKEVNFQSPQIGVPMLVMKEMARHFIDTKLDRLSAKEMPQSFHYYLEGVHDVIVRDVKEGSLRITVECRTLEILERLWEDYCSGHLNAVAEECLLTDDIKRRFYVKSLKLKTTILKEDYLACKLFLTGIFIFVSVNFVSEITLHSLIIYLC